jgi:hypothetical protein
MTQIHQIRDRHDGGQPEAARGMAEKEWPGQENAASTEQKTGADGPREAGG